MLWTLELERSSNQSMTAQSVFESRSTSSGAKIVHPSAPSVGIERASDSADDAVGIGPFSIDMAEYIDIRERWAYLISLTASRDSRLQWAVRALSCELERA